MDERVSGWMVVNQVSEPVATRWSDQRHNVNMLWMTSFLSVFADASCFMASWIH